MGLNLLKALKSGKLTKEAQAEKRINIPLSMTKLMCRNHLGPNKKPMPFAIVFSNPEDLEFECDCGVTYVRTKEVEKEY
jgi:hypothetical protein